MNLPKPQRIEQEADPKAVLYQALRDASELHGRRLHDFPVAQRAHRVAELIVNYSVLRDLPSFQALERDVQTALQRIDR